MQSQVSAGRWYVDSDSGIVPLSAPYDAAIESALQRQQTSLMHRHRNHTYTVDVSNFLNSYYASTSSVGVAIQCNDATQKTRMLTRYPKGNGWEYQENNSSWSAMEGCEYVEYCYSQSTTDIIIITSSAGFQLSLDFGRMKQRNLRTGKIRSIRRKGGAITQPSQPSLTPSAPVPANCFNSGSSSKNTGFSGVAHAAYPTPSAPSLPTNTAFLGGSSVAYASYPTPSAPTLPNNTPVSSLPNTSAPKSNDGDNKKSNKVYTNLLSSSPKPSDICVICQEDMFPSSEKVIKLTACSHCFHLDCIQPLLKTNSQCLKCPVCFKVSGDAEKIMGNQPVSGCTMTTSTFHGHISGLHGKALEINYHLPNGKQTADHPNPGQRYTGTSRTAYLPDTTEGREVLNLLKKAWDRRLIFAIGTSITTGQDNCVTWAGIHHKTSSDGGAYGYPDSTYLARVKGELKDRGVV
mmetsp:Transcript_3599/g.4136  ORF Transcript_3599/g.4136 Transcript_3599/m.4136 type:complete len:462 (+) Transcript_3599:177-1562(+)